MSDDDLKLTSHKIRWTGAAWWYEESHGISVVVEPHAKTTIINIPWGAIRRAMARKDKP